MLTGTNYNGIRNSSAASHFIYALLVKSIITNIYVQWEPKL